MASKLKDGYDTTSLQAGSKGYVVHRDYASHFFRWGWATRFIKRGMKVLEIGCGVDCPLPRVLTYQLTFVPGLYIGVDLNKIPKKPGFGWCKIIDDFNFNRDHKKLNKEDTMDGTGLFDVVVSFEVIEHMEKAEGQKLLAGAHAHLKEGGVFLLSTPVYDGVHLPTAHVHEYTVPELQACIEKAGFEVKDRFGTFGNVLEIRKVLSKEERTLFDELRRFHSDNVISCFMAPKYPDASRNNVWVLTKKAKSAKKGAK